MIGRADPFLSLPVVETWDETPTLRRVAIDGGRLGVEHRTPGQVVRVRVGSGEGYFALANAPGEPRIELLLRRGGAVADEVIDRARPGDELDVTLPFGRGFPVAEATGRDVLLFAAGSGISPIRGLARHLIRARGSFGRVHLFYGERRDTDFAFAHEHAAWAEAGVQVVLCSSQPSATWSGGRGYVQDVAGASGLGGIDAAGAVAFLCGMKNMVSAVRDALATAGLPIERTFLNY